MEQQLQLIGLAAEINTLHDSAQNAAMTAVQYAAKCGEKLIEAKANCQHGEFQQWVADNCKVKERQARKYMKLASELPVLTDPKRQSTAVLNSVETAIAYLSASEETKEKVDNSPDPVTEKQIKAWEREKKELEQSLADAKRELEKNPREITVEVVPDDYESTKSAAEKLARDLAEAKASANAANDKASQLNAELAELERKKKADIKRGVTEGLQFYSDEIEKKKADIERLANKREEARQRYIKASEQATAAEMRGRRLVSAKDLAISLNTEINDLPYDALTDDEIREWSKLADILMDCHQKIRNILPSDIEGVVVRRVA